MTYQITYETEDGTVEAFTTEQTKALAVAGAKRAAKGSALNEAFGVVRWFVEQGGQTIFTAAVAR